MPARYKLPIPAIAVTVAQDVLEILAPTAKSIRLVRLKLNQSNRTNSEQLRYTIKRVTGSPTSGSGGGTITPLGNSSLYSSPSMTVERNNTTRISGGTQDTLVDDAFNILSGLDWVAEDEAAKVETEGATRIVVGLETAPGASTTFSGYAEVEVFG